MGDNSLACCCLTHGQLEIASSVTLWLCRMRARLHTTTWGWGKLMDTVGSAKGGRLQRHQKAGMHLLSAGCFLLMWKNPSKSNQKIPHSPRPPKKNQNKNPNNPMDFWGYLHAKEAGFSSVFMSKRAHCQSQSSTLERRRCEFWTKLERDFLAQISQETGTEKVPQKVLKSQRQSCTGQLFLCEVFPHGKSLLFHSVGNLSLLYTQTFKNTTKFFRKAFSYFWNKHGW